MYNYGEEISYKMELLKADDFDSLQLFQCNNASLNNHLRSGVIKNGEIVDSDGLYYKFVDENTQTMIAVISLAASGILMQVDSYTHILPALKIDVLAVDSDYQKMHYNFDSEQAENADEHYYFSDDILGQMVRSCKEIDEQYAKADYIIVYADKAAYRYYERNGFCDFSEFMVKEQNSEIAENIPMYLDLNN